jgi:hypothetical protein
MDKWFKDILPDKDPYHNRGRDQMRKKGGPEFECLWSHYVYLIKLIKSNNHAITTMTTPDFCVTGETNVRDTIVITS